MDWDEIKRQVEANGGVMTFDMGALRDAHGAGKLGVHITTQISKQLAGIGLGHVPEELPRDQVEKVRLYKKGTPVGDLIDAVRDPSPRTDEYLVQKTQPEGPDYAGMIEKIREIVSE